jgi:glycosyltransferase involved in cell wall biosynthesis
MLPDCLASIRGVADEIVVVDTGSTDATPDIARRAGALVSSFAWCDDFAAARNAALDRAHGHWVLQIDADERLVAPGRGPADRTALRRWLADPPRQVLSADAVSLECRSVMGDTEDVIPVPRLFLRHPARRYVRCIHETVLPPSDTAWRVAALQGVELLHLGYAPAVQASRRKSERNLRLCELAVRERPDDWEIHFYYGLELESAGRKPEALVHFAEAWNRMPPWSVGTALWWRTLTTLGERLRTSTNAEALLDWVGPLLERFPHVAHLHFLRGEALRLLGRLDEALASLYAALTLPASGIDWEPQTTKPFCWNAVGAIYEQADLLDLARQAYLQATALGPTAFTRERLAALEGAGQTPVST